MCYYVLHFLLYTHSLSLLYYRQGVLDKSLIYLGSYQRLSPIGLVPPVLHIHIWLRDVVQLARYQEFIYIRAWGQSPEYRELQWYCPKIDNLQLFIL